ncbi:recombinase family protein [bacterium]|nr:MAG: recombinase family protein [bacterium]
MRAVYARVSTHNQGLALQREALSKAGCEIIYEGKVSGSRQDRAALERAIERARKGDALVVWKLDHLGTFQTAS